MCVSVSAQIFEKMKDNTSKDNMSLAANFKVFYDVIQKNTNTNIEQG
jgi:hypothetical protein